MPTSISRDGRWGMFRDYIFKDHLLFRMLLTDVEELIPAQRAGFMCFLAYNEKEEEPDKYQNRASGQGQRASGKKYERKADKHDYEGDAVHNYCVFIIVHNMLLIF
jgi:hypothetical protein